MNALERHVHDRASELAASAIDFALTSAETIELEAHLFDCPQCARDAAGLRADAMAIRAPVALLPSRRVDGAVYREIARDGARPQRFLLLAAAALLLLAMLGVVAVGAALLRTQDTGPITVVPTAPVVVVSPAEPVASSIDPVVLLRVELFGDLPVGRWPSLTVFRDGTVLRWDGSGQRITRLTPVGLELLLAPVTDSDLLVRSGRIGTDLTGPAHGFASYTIVFRRGQEIVHRSASDPPTPANRAEAERIIALAEHLDDLESWLPADAWAIGPASATPYVPSDYLLKVTVFENQPGVDYPPLALDVGAFHWPLEGRLDNFGEALTEPPLGAGSVSRCGLLTLAEATAVLRALAAAPLVQEAERMVANLAWAFANSRITVSLAPLLPDDPRECAVDRNWP